MTSTGFISTRVFGCLGLGRHVTPVDGSAPSYFLPHFGQDQLRWEGRPEGRPVPAALVTPGQAANACSLPARTSASCSTAWMNAFASVGVSFTPTRLLRSSSAVSA